MIKNAILFSTLAIIFASCGNSPEKDDKNDSLQILADIDNKMQEQEDCWNAGDLPCFMQHYWKSDSLRFIGSKGLTYGWQQTLDNYITSYPDKSTMGKLKFTNEVREMVDVNTVQVIGQWQLMRADSLGSLQGYYSLLWKNKNDKWVIISDHSS